MLEAKYRTALGNTVRLAAFHCVSGDGASSRAKCVASQNMGAVCQGIRGCPGGEDESSSRWRADAQACRRSGWTRDEGRVLGRERRLRNPKEPATSIPTVAFQVNLRRCVVPLVQSRRILHILQAARANARYDRRILVERRVPRTSLARLGEDAGSRSNRCPPQFCDDRAYGLHNASRVGCQMPRVAAAPNATIKVAWTLHPDYLPGTAISSRITSPLFTRGALQWRVS